MQLDFHLNVLMVCKEDVLLISDHVIQHVDERKYHVEHLDHYRSQDTSNAHTHVDQRSSTSYSQVTCAHGAYMGRYHVTCSLRSITWSLQLSRSNRCSNMRAIP